MRVWGLWSALAVLVLGGLAHGAKPLSQPHAHLDHQDQCNRCHVPFGGVPPEKCRDCHRDIDQRLKAGKGFHGRAAGAIPCNTCHREHLGRGHDVTGLDRRAFDHGQTGWPLSGSHERVECRKCHTAKRPGSNRDSYLGAPTACNECHGEYHGRGVKANLSRCDNCHNTQEWSLINENLRFNHERESRFPRTGEHKAVECNKCHLGRRNFGPIQVQGCVTCHRDPHPPGALGGRICEECHVTTDFKDSRLFDHGSTGWPLKGKHKQTKCLDCHDWKQWKPRTNDCVGCHEDSHRGQFKGTPCQKCHQESGFKNLKFNHDTMSRFPLRGKHSRVDCAKCHPNGKYKPVDIECVSCHESNNPHGDTFEGRSCSNCHSPTGWRDTRFDHGITGFPLLGRHEDQPCYRCHPNGTETEDDTIKECAFCHRNVHRDQFEGAGCERCHLGFDRWLIPYFDHSISRFELKGKHTEVACIGCHRDGHYRPIDSACGNCHQNFHEGQFSTPCEQCHTPENWSSVDFDHDKQSEYTLYGKHREIDCKKCHVDNDYKGVPMTCEGCHLDVHLGTKGADCSRCHTTEDWTINSRQNHDFGAQRIEGVHDLLPCETCHGPDRSRALAGLGPECVNCHRDPHFGSLGPLCGDCHTQNHFLPSTFLHTETGFRLSGAHRFVECRNCHPGRVFGGLPSTCDFCHSDTFAATRGTDCDHTELCPQGLFTCHNCHTTQSFVPARPGVNCGTCESRGR